jgi:hypothetical protein
MNSNNEPQYLHPKEVNITKISGSANISGLNSIRNIEKDKEKSLNRFSTPIENIGLPPNYFEMNRVIIGASNSNKRSQLYEDSHAMHLKSMKDPSNAVDGMASVLSALYCKILVVIGL